MIKIVFYPGTHGNYLEFVLNKLLYSDKITMTTPLTTELGTSHKQRTDINYQNYRFFNCDESDIESKNNRTIKINFDEDDTLTVFQLNLKRGEDCNVDPNLLTENTYFTLFDKFGPFGQLFNGLNHTIDTLNQYSEIDSYYNIKSESWPNITTVEEFYRLPEEIISECAEVFNVKLFILNEDHPHCPRYILRDMFKHWFIDNLAYKEIQQAVIENKNTYSINLRSFYNRDQFVNELKNIEKHFNLTFNYDVLTFHQEFINRVPYINSLNNCKNIIHSVSTNENIPISINVIEEAFINFCLEKKYKVSMPFLQEKYFSDTNELRKYINV